ncbi:hypothetical protein FRC11_012090 [Ceratobasidium sp. 423]|nr:hypothetical protein FRC11_012090 [Ceratobasidium sp. 423]
MAIRKWYRQQPTTTFTSIEYRKEVGGLFRHEFVVVHLGDSTVCRFDRRAREDLRGHALKNEGTISEDSAHAITSEDTEHRTFLDRSEILLSMTLPQELDLKFILAVCYGIQFHPKAKAYSLLYYNCYFFSWTLITTIARRASQWEAIMESEPMRKEISEIIALEYSLAMKLRSSGPTSKLRSKPVKPSFIRRIWGVVSCPEATNNTAKADGVRGYQTSRRVGFTWVLEQNTNEHAHGDLGSGTGAGLVAPKGRTGERFPNRGRLHVGLQQKLKYAPDILSNVLEKLLLKSQISRVCPMLRRGIDSTLLEASEIVAGQFAIDASLEHNIRGLFARDLDYAPWLVHVENLPDFIESVTASIASRANQKITRTLNTSTGAYSAFMGGNDESITRHKLAMDLGEEEWENNWDDACAKEMSARSLRDIVNFSPLDISPSAGKDAWRKAWEVSCDERIRETIITKIADKLSAYLVDPPFVVAQPGSKVNLDDVEGFYTTSPHTSEGSSITSKSQESTSQTLQDYIRMRMATHFEQVESYGFGRARGLIDQAEDSMCEIWDTAVRMMRVVAPA